MPAIALDVQHPEAADGPVVAFPPETALTESNAEDLDRELSELAAVHGPRLTLDLSGVAVLTSVILGKLLSLNSRLQARGGRLALRNPRPTIHMVFKASKLDGLLDIRTGTG